jgi:hypothetical protein
LLKATFIDLSEAGIEGGSEIWLTGARLVCPDRVSVWLEAIDWLRINAEDTVVTTTTTPEFREFQEWCAAHDFCGSTSQVDAEEGVTRYMICEDWSADELKAKYVTFSEGTVQRAAEIWLTGANLLCPERLSVWIEAIDWLRDNSEGK